MLNLQTGLTAELVHTVRAQDSAENWGNELPVLATPVLLWLGELAAMRALEGWLAEGSMTVGTAHNAAHLAPTPTGATVRVSARLIEIDGPRLRFAVEAADPAEVVYRGTHDRAVVVASRFRTRVTDKRDRLLGAGGDR